MKCGASARSTSSPARPSRTPSRVVIALGGSTNAVLHLLAIAHAAKVKLSLDDFTRIGKRVPVLADLKPSGKHLMSELVAIGGIRPLMKMLLDKGLLHGDCLTVTGETMAENLRGVKPYPAGQDHHPAVRRTRSKRTATCVILRGNLAPKAPWPRSPARKACASGQGARVRFRGSGAGGDPRRHGQVKGDVIVIRYEGPRGGPGMREMLAPTSAIMGKGLGKDVALITDGRFSGGSHGFVVGHITPEAASAARSPSSETATPSRSTPRRRSSRPSPRSRKFAAKVHSGAIAGPEGQPHAPPRDRHRRLGPRPPVREPRARAPGRDRMKVHFFDNTDPDGMDYVLAGSGRTWPGRWSSSSRSRAAPWRPATGARGRGRVQGGRPLPPGILSP
jgi:hypothetical protein